MTDLALLVLLAALIVFARIAWRTHLLNQGKVIKEGGFISARARAWHRFTTDLEAKDSAARADWRARREEKARQLSRQPSMPPDQIRNGKTGPFFSDTQRHPDDGALAAAHREIAELQAQVASLHNNRERRTISERPKIKYDQNRPTRSNGARAVFVYADAQGEITDREITNWSITGERFSGFCLLRNGVRTFRLNHVVEWVAWE
jgi:hypothetical protein